MFWLGVSRGDAVADERDRPASANAQWDSRSVGKPWQFAFFGAVIRWGGRWLAYGCMVVVVAWYVLFSRLVRQRCRAYLDRRFGQTAWLPLRWWRTYRWIVALGASLIDRGAYGALGPRALSVQFPEGLRLKALAEENRGLIVLNCHVGCWQVAMSAFRFLKTPVSVVMHQGQADIDPRWFSESGREAPFAIIDPNQPMGGILQMIQVLKEGQVLGIMADRVFGSDPNTLEVPFMKAPVRFPVSPYRLASMQGSPIAVVFSYKSGYSTYCIEIARVIRVPEGLGRSNQAYRAYLMEFVKTLEDFVEAHPWQFFNFHNMWEDCSPVPTDIG